MSGREDGEGRVEGVRPIARGQLEDVRKVGRYGVPLDGSLEVHDAEGILPKPHRHVGGAVRKLVVQAELVEQSGRVVALDRGRGAGVAFGAGWADWASGPGGI